MTVAELIEELLTFDQESIVMVSGYEYGVQEDFGVGSNKIQLDYYGEKDFGGNHRVMDYDDDFDDRELTIISAVVISR